MISGFLELPTCTLEKEFPSVPRENDKFLVLTNGECVNYFVSRIYWKTDNQHNTGIKLYVKLEDSWHE